MKRLAVAGAVGLLALWMALNATKFFGEAGSFLHLMVALVLAGLILLRPKPAVITTSDRRAANLSASAIFGLLLFAVGTVLSVSQLQWLGVLTTAGVCLNAALSPERRIDVLKAFFVLYWGHPLPGQVAAYLQMTLQAVSVSGAEWLLQGFNTRVWADGMVLVADARFFGIPEACSGMRTGTTVALFALGIGILLRMKWHLTLAFVVVGVVQSVLLNVIRISLMVIFARGKPDSWAIDFLHDSLGGLLLGAMVLVLVQMITYAKWRTRGGSRSVSAGHGALNRWRLVALFLLLMLAAGLFLYHNRAYHRGMMIADVVEQLLAVKPPAIDSAESACKDALRLAPNNVDVLLNRVQIDLIRKAYVSALERLDSFSPEGEQAAFHSILKARALMATGRSSEAGAIVLALPPDVAALPSVAMIKAELAAQRDDVVEVSANVLAAARWGNLLDRIRALYPYLMSRNEWDVIVRSSSDEPQSNVSNAVAEIHARLQVGDYKGAGRVIEYASRLWPESPMLQGYLINIAQKETEETWRMLFSDEALVKRFVGAASRRSMVQEVRAFFPYLASREQWGIIAQCHSPEPFFEISHALIDIHANIRVKQWVHAGVTLQNALTMWPHDGELLKYLPIIATESDDIHLDDIIRDSCQALGADELASLAGACFSASRPDLGWLLYAQLIKTDVDHPGAFMLPAQFGDLWFTFKKHHLGIPDGSAEARIDVGAFYQAWRTWPEIPFVDAFAQRSTYQAQMDCARRALAEFDARKKLGTLHASQSDRHDRARRLVGLEKHVATGEAVATNATVQGIRTDTARILVKPLSPAEQAAFVPWLNEHDSDADSLCTAIERAFESARPDLAWRAYHALSGLDRTHPMLMLIPAEYGDSWFLFQADSVGLARPSSPDRVDLRVAHVKASQWPPPPLGTELLHADFRDLRKQYLSLCLSALARKEKEHAMSLQFHMMHVKALELAGNVDDALAKMDQLSGLFPEKRQELLLARAELLAQQKKWAEAYETLEAYRSGVVMSRSSADERETHILMQLGLPGYAMHVAERSADRFGSSEESLRLCASVRMAIGAYEDALFLLEKTTGWRSLPSAGTLLFHANRYEASAMAQRVQGRQAFVMPRRPAVIPFPAERVLDHAWAPRMDGSNRVAECDRLRALRDEGGSPFVTGLVTLKLAFLEGIGDAASDAGAWMAVGRTDIEQAIALGELLTLQVASGNYAQAKSLAMAMSEMKELPSQLWRAAIASTAGERVIIDRARRAFPYDSSVWLAYMLVRFREEGWGNWGDEELAEVMEENLIPVGTLVRLGDFLLRNGALAPATLLGDHSARLSGGYLPAEVLNLRCSLKGGKRFESIASASRAAELTPNPWPFYRIVAGLRSKDATVDFTTKAMIEKLFSEFPNETVWGEQLGDMYLRSGDSANALRILNEVMARNPDAGTSPSMLIHSAQAALMQGDVERAVSILESAYRAYPQHVMILNNLVFTLAVSGDGRARAQDLLPHLLELAGDRSLAVLETAAVVYRQTDQNSKAKDYLQRAIDLVDDVDPYWIEMNPTIVDLNVYEGRYDSRTFVRNVEEDEELRQIAGRLVKQLNSRIRVEGVRVGE